MPMTSKPGLMRNPRSDSNSPHHPNTNSGHSSNVISIDGQPLPPHRFASSRTAAMVPSFSLVAELLENRDRYACTEWMAIQALPGYIRTCIERVCTSAAKADPNWRPGSNAVIAAAIHRGVEVLASHPDVVATFKIRDKLNSMIAIDADWGDELSAFLRTFSLSSPDAAGSGSKRVNLTVPNHIKVELTEMSGELGVSASALTVTCLAMTLQHEPCVLRERRLEMAKSMDRFFKRVEIRRAVAEVWLDKIREVGPMS